MRPDELVAVASERRSKVVAYLNLGKARIYQHTYGLLLAILLVHTDGSWHRELWPALLIAFLALQAIQYSASAADDLGGFKDGSDAMNYAGRPAVTVAKKPLLTGAISEREAVRFVIGCYLAGVAACLVGAWVGHIHSLAPVLTLVTIQTLVLQYSLGFKLSYRPLGLELTVFAATAAIVVMPYWFATGKVTAAALTTGALFGTWFLMVVCYGNASDIAGDKTVSRSTLAVLLPIRAYKCFLACLYVLSLVLLGIVFGQGVLVSWRSVWFMLPLVGLHTVQVYSALTHNQWRRARFMGILSLDLGALGLTAAALLG